MTQTNSIYEIGLADIFITRNVNYVTNSRITDTRYETGRCGIVSSVSEWDTTTITQQIEAMLAEKSDAFDEVIAQDDSDFQTWFESVQEQLSDDVAGRLLTLITNTRMQTGLPAEYDSTHSYTAGEYCLHDDVMYACTANTTGDWDSTKWRATTVVDEMTSARKIVNTDGSNRSIGNINTPVYISGGYFYPCNSIAVTVPKKDKSLLLSRYSLTVPLQSGETVSQVVLGGQRLVVFGTTNVYCYNFDTSSWSSNVSPGYPSSLHYIDEVSMFYVFIRADSSAGTNTRVVFSKDGINWKSKDLIGESSVLSKLLNNLSKIVWDGEKFFDGYAGISYDGVVWSAGGPSDPNVKWVRNNKKQFMGFSLNRDIFYVYDKNNTAYTYANIGIFASSGTDIPISEGDIIFTHGYKYVGSGSSRYNQMYKIYSTDNGVTWNTPSRNYAQSAVAVGGAGMILSTYKINNSNGGTIGTYMEVFDGTSWSTPVMLRTETNVDPKVSYSNGRFAIVFSDGSVVYMNCRQTIPVSNSYIQNEIAKDIDRALHVGGIR